MTVRRSSPLVVALLCGALVAGCGSSSSSTTNGSTATTAPAKSATAAPSSPVATTTSTSPTATSTGAASAAAVKQYVALCKSISQRESTLAANVKRKVEGICNKAASGDLAGARAAAKEVCVEVINASPIPAATKQKALAACKAS